MTDLQESITVQVGGKEYRVDCAPDQVASLKQATDLIEQQVSRLQTRGYAPNTERCLMMLALQMAHELVCIKNQQNDHVELMSQKILELQKKIEKELAERS